MTKRKNRAKRKALMLPASPRRRADGRVQSPGPSQRERDARATAVAARVRHGIEPDHATDPLAGYPIGRAVLAGDLTRDDHDRLRAYAVADSAARAADGRPPINPPAIVLGASRGRAPATEPTAAELDAIRLHGRMRAAVLAVLGSDGLAGFEDAVLCDAPLQTRRALFLVELGAAAMRRVIE